MRHAASASLRSLGGTSRIIRQANRLAASDFLDLYTYLRGLSELPDSGVCVFAGRVRTSLSKRTETLCFRIEKVHKPKKSLAGRRFACCGAVRRLDRNWHVAALQPLPLHPNPFHTPFAPAPPPGLAS